MRRALARLLDALAARIVIRPIRDLDTPRAAQ